MALPPPNENQPYCDVSALEAGHIDLPDNMFMKGAPPGKVTLAPSLSFLLRHSTTKKTLVFDLGIKKDLEANPMYHPAFIEKVRKRVHVNQDVVESLARGGLSPDDIDYVCLSHCHFDHTGDPKAFTKSTFLVGGACQKLLTPGYLTDPNAIFHSDLLPQGQTIFYDITSEDWAPISVFPRALDFFGDGSLYIVDAPGHLSGHINILARTSSDGGWVYLAGDSAHHWNIITLESEIADDYPGLVNGCAHEDKETAEGHIFLIHELTKERRVRVILAHDEPFYSENRDGEAFWPGKIPSL